MCKNDQMSGQVDQQKPGSMMWTPEVADATAPGESGIASVRISTVRLAGLDPTFGNAATPVVCVELLGATGNTSISRDPADIVLVVDCSYSMGNSISQVKQTVLQVFEMLLEEDRIGLVKFSERAEVLVPLTRKADVYVERFAVACDKIRLEGGTNLYDSLGDGVGMLLEQDPGSEGNPDQRQGLVLILSW
jgi:Ca-activated chloride channel family protein